MPWADFRCDRCGHVREDVVFSSARGAVASAPVCPYHGAHRFPMSVIPQCRFDLKSDGEGGKGFQKFRVHRQVPTRGGLVQVEEEVSSLHRLRQIEHDSEQRYRDGEGEPLRFRAYQQDRSNLDQSSFGREGRIGDRTYDSGRAPAKKPNIGVTRHGQQKPKIPVARVGGVSPLPLK